jgi:hypothetical protein
MRKAIGKIKNEVKTQRYHWYLFIHLNALTGIYNMNSIYPSIENVPHSSMSSITHHSNLFHSNNYPATMATNNPDAGCPEDRTIRVYNYSFLTVMRKSPNETPTQFNQCRMLVLDFVCKAANLIHLVTKQTYERSNLAVHHAYEECISMKSLGINMFGKGSVQCCEYIYMPS